MDYLTEPLDALAAEAALFVRREDLSVLHVTVEDVLIDAARRVLAGSEWHPDNTRQVLVVGDDEEQERGIWHTWTSQLSSEYMRVSSAYAAAGILAPALPRSRPEQAGPVEFARQVHLVASNLSALNVGVGGVMLLLNLPSVEMPRGLGGELAELVALPQMAAVKWVLIERGASVGAALASPVDAARIRSIECGIDPARQAAELASLLDTLAGAEGGSDPHPRPGEAWPDCPTPPHPSEPGTPANEMAPAASPAKPANLSLPFLRAVQALHGSDPIGAINALRSGRAMASNAADLPVVIEMDLFLATLLAERLLAAELDRDPALDLLHSTAQRAREAHLSIATAKSELMLGSLAMRTGDPLVAAQAFARAADAAEDSNAITLAIEALYFAGEAYAATNVSAAEDRLIRFTTSAWERAIRLATTLPAAEAKRSRASTCARRLADLYRRRRLTEHARAAAETAETLESGLGLPNSGSLGQRDRREAT